MSHHLGKAGNSGTFHFVVGDGVIVVAERFNFGVQIGVGERKAHVAALRAVKSDGGNGYSTNHIVPDALHQFFIGAHHIRRTVIGRPVDVFLKRFFEIFFAHFARTGVIVQQPVETDGLFGNHVRTHWAMRLHSARCAHANHGQLLELGFYLTRGEIDVCQRVQFRYHNIDVVGSDTVRKGGEPLSFIHTRNGVKLAAADIALNAVEKRSGHRNPVGVAHHHNFVRKLFRFDVKMKRAAIGVDDKF